MFTGRWRIRSWDIAVWPIQSQHSYERRPNVCWGDISVIGSWLIILQIRSKLCGSQTTVSVDCCTCDNMQSLLREHGPVCTDCRRTCTYILRYLKSLPVIRQENLCFPAVVRNYGDPALVNTITNVTITNVPITWSGRRHSDGVKCVTGSLVSAVV